MIPKVNIISGKTSANVAGDSPPRDGPQGMGSEPLGGGF